MAGTTDAIIIFAIIVLIIIVIYLGIFHKPGASDPNSQYVAPTGLGTSCNFSSDCVAGMYCTSKAVKGPTNGQAPTETTNPSVCSPYCASYYDNTKTYHDTCQSGFTPSATCTWIPSPTSAYNCQQKSCSANSDCAPNTEICAPNNTGASLCYPVSAPCSTIGNNCFGTSGLVCTVASSGSPTCQLKTS